jgi:signal transduction histidine kinase
MTAAATTPEPRASRRAVRRRLALGMTLVVLVVAALVGVAGAALASWRASDPEPTTRTQVEQVGDQLAVVVVRSDDPSTGAAAARADALRWLLVALAASFVPAAAGAWLESGRLLVRVDDALRAVEATDAERERRLNEVIHELRTPLAIVTTNLELAAATPGPEAACFVEASQRAVERMSRTVDDLAGHGRLAVSAASDTVDLAAEARALAAQHRGPAGVRNIKVEVVDRLPDGTFVHGDPAAVRGAVGNLLANAVRLAPAGSTIRVGCGTVGEGSAGWAWLGVADEGPGIPAKDHARVFERHWRGAGAARQATADGQPGGLGLTIARQLTEAQGGLLTVTSAEGTGSRFVVWLPLGPDAEEADVVAADGIHPVADPFAGLLGGAGALAPAR